METNKIKYWTIGLVFVFLSFVFLVPARIGEYLSEKYGEMLDIFTDKLDGWWGE